MGKNRYNLPNTLTHTPEMLETVQMIKNDGKNI